MDFTPVSQNYQGPTTTAHSAADGRLKVGVSKGEKRKIIKKHLKKYE